MFSAEAVKNINKNELGQCLNFINTFSPQNYLKAAIVVFNVSYENKKSVNILSGDTKKLTQSVQKI